MVHTHTHTYTHTHTDTRVIIKKELLPFVTAWIYLEGIMLSKSEKDKY